MLNAKADYYICWAVVRLTLQSLGPIDLTSPQNAGALLQQVCSLLALRIPLAGVKLNLLQNGAQLDCGSVYSSR
ncbi:hypothetical protein NDU88_001260 [Pleurodeles waltl]|uniref:Uncharacterized protein n=1 Tax=Pleurodeles waltl TaxID=8319 RepID=A0AAV7Q5H4_PLEWA|nr:hypothetical protein NDU88_001260 [Pleurodeles waltl]